MKYQVDREGFMGEWERFESGAEPHPEDIAGNLAVRDREADLRRHAFLMEHGLGNFYKLPPDHVGYITGATMEKLVDRAIAAPAPLAQVRATLLALAKVCNARGFDSPIDNSPSQKFWYGLRDEGYAAIEVLDALAHPQSPDTTGSAS